MTEGIYGLRLLRDPRVRLAALVVLVVVVLAFRAVQFGIWTTRIQWGYDFSAYWAAAGHLLEGAAIYAPDQLAGPYAPQRQFLYLYPPPLAAAVTPLAFLFPDDYRLAAGIWAALGAIVIVATVLALHRTERLGERFGLLAGRGRWLLVAGAFALPPVVGELVLGNVHLLLLGLLAVAWLGVRRADRGDARGEALAGFAVGVAAVIKVFPGLLLLWFLATGRLRAAAWLVVGAVAAVVVALPLTGIEPWRDYPTVLANISAPLDTTDTLAPTVWLAPFVGFVPARLLVTGVAVVVLAWSARSRQPAASFAAAVVLSLLVAPALYHHYLAILVLPFLLALSAGRPVRLLALAYLFLWGGSQAGLGDLAWLVNRAMPTLGAVVLLGVLSLPDRQPGRLTATARAGPGP